MQRLVTGARMIMEDRPIFTRRSLPNCIPGDDWEAVGLNTAKYVYQYVGYIFASGPWRDAIVKFGVDPRKDPKYRIYQTMMFMLESEPKDSRAKYSRSKPKREKTEQELRKESHLFDGKHVSKDGKVWQVCDVTDPILQTLLATSNIRQTCHVSPLSLLPSRLPQPHPQLTPPRSRSKATAGTTTAPGPPPKSS